MEELEEFTVRMFPIKRERRLVQPEPPVSVAPPSEKAPPNIQSRVRSFHVDVMKAALRLVTLRGTVLRRSAGLGEVLEVPLGLVSPRGDVLSRSETQRWTPSKRTCSYANQ